jgi:hypothetical protein
MPQRRPSTQSDSDRSIDQQIGLLEQELVRVIDLPTTPRDLRARLVARLAALKARTADRQTL